MNRVVELYSIQANTPGVDWPRVVIEQNCGYVGGRCFKVRKSAATTTIGTCTVLNGRHYQPVLICPNRLLEQGKIFRDCMHLLEDYQQGDELHIVSEIEVPGGKVDFVMVSKRGGRIVDFVGIELQTLDTTGTVWPERQRLLRDLNVHRDDAEEYSSDRFSMNWKMSAKTILMQMHHKIGTFQHVNKKLVLVVQDSLLEYMQRRFSFGAMRRPNPQDSAQIHPYRVLPNGTGGHSIHFAPELALSTDADGIAACLTMQDESRVELDVILEALEEKMSVRTRQFL